MNRREMREEEEKLAPWAQAGYEASGLANGRPWASLSTLERRAWVAAADAILAAYDEEWPSRKGGL